MKSYASKKLLSPNYLSPAKPLLIISGPTATGKTALAVKIANKYQGELISADSRQIYQGLDIGIGKDHPTNTPIHLINLLPPTQYFSASQFRVLALQKISEIHSRGHLPIVVGCTGFYINSLLQPYSTFTLPPRPILRFVLNRLSLIFLQKIYFLLDRKNYRLLNNSDINNPRRLIRKIEIAVSPFPQRGIKGDFNLLHLSLTAPLSFLYSRIDQRVNDRLTLGHLQELNSLLTKYRWSDPGLQVSAYQVFHPYYQHTASLTECVQKWKFREHRDARHQKTFFKKIPHLTFIDISRPRFSASALSLISKWYNQL